MLILIEWSSLFVVDCFMEFYEGKIEAVGVEKKKTVGFW